jgi:hypothetical protein
MRVLLWIFMIIYPHLLLDTLLVRQRMADFPRISWKKHTAPELSLPDFYLQNTRKLA